MVGRPAKLWCSDMLHHIAQYGLQAFEVISTITTTRTKAAAINSMSVLLRNKRTGDRLCVSVNTEGLKVADNIFHHGPGNCRVTRY